MFFPLGDVDDTPARLRRVGRRERQSAPDPFGEHGDLSFRQLPGRRHLHVLVVVSNRLNDQALLDITDHRCRPAVTAGKNRFAAVEQQPALQLLRLRRMTFKAALNEQRPNSLLKEVEISR